MTEPSNSDHLLNERGELLYNFSFREQKSIGFFIGLLSIMLGFSFIWVAFYGGTTLARRGVFHWLLIIVGVFIILLIGCRAILFFIPSWYENIWTRIGIPLFTANIYSLKKKELFIPFKKIENIELVTLPIGIRCLRIKVSNKIYEITEKETRCVEDIYKKLTTTYKIYREKYNIHVHDANSIFYSEK